MMDAARTLLARWLGQQTCCGYRLLSRLGLFPKGYFQHNFVQYADLVRSMRAKPAAGYRRVRCVTPGFDNSARRRHNATIFLNSTPEQYGHWLEQTLAAERALGLPADEQLVFVNAWNEWAEGNHLEPDQRWGRAYLEAHRAAVQGACSAAAGT